MSDPVALITGAGGEMGRLLLPTLRERGMEVVALDLADAPEDLGSLYREWAKMNILDNPFGPPGGLNDFTFNPVSDLSPAHIPEPGTVLLLGVALLALTAWGRRER